jgi:hypothetical protein
MDQQVEPLVPGLVVAHKLFELEISARKASIQRGISYPTVLKAFHIILMDIVAHSLDGDFA